MQGKIDAKGRRLSYPQDISSSESARSLFQRRRTLSPVAEGSSIGDSKTIRMAVLGKDGVGKTAFTVRLLTRRFIGDYDGTLERWYQHRVDIDGQDVQVHVFDTAGKNCMEKIDTCSTLDLLFVLYSITDRSSFQEATLIVKYLLETKNIPASTIYLIATKADLKRHTEVTEFEGRLFAINIGCFFQQLSNLESYTEHCKILKQAFLAVSSQSAVSTQKLPKSPLMRRLRDGLKTKMYGGQTNDAVCRKRSGSVEF